MDVNSYDISNEQQKFHNDESSMKIVGVKNINKFNGCLKCSSRVVKCEEDSNYGICVKCEML